MTGEPASEAVDPSSADLEAFLAAAQDAPFVMLNLVRYAEGQRGTYTDYLRRSAPFVEAAGGEVLYMGKGMPPLVPGGAGGAQHWDAVLLVRYPSPEAFRAMLADPGYQEVSRLRTEALSAAVLQPTQPVIG